MSKHSHKTHFRRDSHAHFPFVTSGSAFSPHKGGELEGGAFKSLLLSVSRLLPRLDFYLFEDYPWPLSSRHKVELLRVRTDLVIYLRRFVTPKTYESICYARRPSPFELRHGYRFRLCDSVPSKK